MQVSADRTRPNTRVLRDTPAAVPTTTGAVPDPCIEGSRLFLRLRSLPGDGIAQRGDSLRSGLLRQPALGICQDRIEPAQILFQRWQDRLSIQRATAEQPGHRHNCVTVVDPLAGSVKEV